MKGTVYLVRHGATSYNSDEGERFRGWVDIPLNGQGKLDAAKATKNLEDKDISKIYVSDLKRTQETAEELATKLGIEAENTRALRPWHIGVYSGKLVKPNIEDLNWIMAQKNVAPKGGESFRQFVNRWLSKLLQIIEEARKEQINIAVFTHFRNLKVVEAWKSAGYKSDFTLDLDEMKKDDLKTGQILTIKPKEKVDGLS